MKMNGVWCRKVCYVSDIERKDYESESYTYLGNLEGYCGRLRKDLKSKLNGGNLVQGVNTWTVSLLRY